MRCAPARLIDLTKNWCEEAIYKGGYYHGDLHAGNIMVDTDFKLGKDGMLARKPGKDGQPGPIDLTDNKGLTVIDFGNATQLSKEQRTNVLRMMAAAAAKDTNAFIKGFKALMTDDGQTKFEERRHEIHDMIHNVLSLGKMSDSGSRIAVILGKLQQMGFELPAPIFRFSQCQIRLQGTINEMNELIAQVEKDLANLRTPSDLRPDELEADRANPLMKVLEGVATGEERVPTWNDFERAIDGELLDLTKKNAEQTLTRDLLEQVLPGLQASNTQIEKYFDELKANIHSLAGLQPGGPDLVAAYDAFDTGFTLEERKGLPAAVPGVECVQHPDLPARSRVARNQYRHGEIAPRAGKAQGLRRA